MISVIIILLIATNIITIYLLKRKKIKKYFAKSFIKSVNLEKVNKIFESEKISENLYGPKKDVIVKSFCIPSGQDIVGITSNYEAWILSSLSKISKNIFEFGTCSGKTTTLMALNSPNDSKIITLTLDSNQAKNLSSDSQDNKVSIRNIINESNYNKFIFSGKEYEEKISVMFMDSKKLNADEYLNKFDLIFIDGGHTYSIIENDSIKAFKMIKAGGIILWHDYVPGKTSDKDVVKYLNKISKYKKIFHIENTSLCYFNNI
jgi:predicted O-methyltransferase YrrM|tara:strand:- start:1349 stop:2131 length:783 start_codon:yes stop_codon:yes gene_type:complete